MIELAEVIGQLRTELDDARTAAAGHELQFALGPVELEVTVELRRDGGAAAKVRFYVVELGGEGKVTSSSAQRIKLTLNPQLASAQATGASAPTSQASPVTVYVGGNAVQGER
jgi:Trypsin-co-occurring domain 2